MERTFQAEYVDVDELKPHPRNYRVHPDDQIRHLIESLDEHDFYKNIVVARDNTILIGHGIVLAARLKGIREIPVIRKDYDPDEPRAIKLLTADNELGNLAEVDDRLLTELLKEVHEQDPDGLLGTGFDEHMLAGLVLTTRTKQEIQDFDEAAEWVGMPDYDEGKGDPIKLILSFETESDRQEVLDVLGIENTKKNTGSPTLSSWYPPKERQKERPTFILE